MLTGNDPRLAFDRIVTESSDYYVLGYSPATRGKPGEFQPIRVRVNAALLPRVERTDGSVVLESEEDISPGPGPRSLPFAVPINTASLAPGRYLLRMRLDTARPTARSERVVPFEVVPNTVQR